MGALALQLVTPAMLGLMTVMLAPGQDILVDDVVAVVNRHVITRSEIRQEAALVLVEQGGDRGLDREITSEFLVKVMELLINQRVLLDEAQKIGVPPVSEQERERLLMGFRRRFSDPELYARFLYAHDISEGEIGDILVRHYRVERLKERKLRVMPEVTREEVRQYYEKHRIELGNASFELVAEAIRLKLLTRQREKELARWIWDLRKRAEVKVLIDLAEEKAGQ
jgi:peptidyl-prolyl cis-trans isomerase SurA